MKPIFKSLSSMAFCFAGAKLLLFCLTGVVGINIQFMNNSISRNTWHIGSSLFKDISIALRKRISFSLTLGAKYEPIYNALPRSSPRRMFINYSTSFSLLVVASSLMSNSLACESPIYFVVLTVMRKYYLDSI